MARGVPNTGLYKGRAGEAQANKDPVAFLTALLRHAGLGGDTGTARQTWAREVAPTNLYEQYQEAQAKRQKLSIVDFMRKAYGARFAGPQGTRVRTGRLGNVLDESFGHWSSNTDPEGYAQAEAIRQGITMPNGNSQFQNFFSTNFLPGLKARYDVASSTAGGQPGAQGTDFGGADYQPQTRFGTGYQPQGAGGPAGIKPLGGGKNAPNLNFDDWLKTIDLAGEARRAYAFRPDMERFGSPGQAQGRWSWWS